MLNYLNNLNKTKKCDIFFFKSILILTLLIYILSYVYTFKKLINKKEINANQINELKNLIDTNKKRIKKLETKINSFRNLNYEYSRLINKTLLKLNIIYEKILSFFKYYKL